MTHWLSEIALPKKPHDCEYGYIPKNTTEPITCDKSTLLEMLEEDENIKFVTTPEHNTFIIPGSDFFTLQPLLKKRTRKIKEQIRISLIGMVVIGVFLALVLPVLV